MDKKNGVMYDITLFYVDQVMSGDDFESSFGFQGHILFPIKLKPSGYGGCV